MHHINFLPWRTRLRDRKNLRFLIYLGVLWLLLQFICVGYWQYLKERSETFNNIVAHQSVQQTPSSVSDQWPAFFSLYHYIRLRSDQRHVLIDLLPYFAKHEISDLNIEENKWQAVFIFPNVHIAQQMLAQFPHANHSELIFKNKSWQLIVSEEFNV